MLPIVPKIKELQEIFLEDNLLVLQTKHGNTLQDCGQMYTWWGSINSIDDPLAEIVPELKNPKIPIIKKTQNDAFWNTDLESELKAKGVTQIIICGVMTHLCCESTARAAFVRGFEVFFVIDGTATYNEDLHFGTLLNLAHGFALPVLSSELVATI